MSSPIDVVVAAAGSGERLGFDVPKAFVDVGGSSLLARALEAAAAIGARHTVVTVPMEGDDDWAARVEDVAGDQRVEAVRGGPTRQASVFLGLKALGEWATTTGDPEVGVVLVHDAARPCASVDLWRRVAVEAERTGAAIPILPSVDSLKRIDDEGAILGAVDRRRIVRAQTPQGFRFDMLFDAHLDAARQGVEGTDDAALVERMGQPVAAVAGEESNIKVTTPEDLTVVSRSLAKAGSGDVLFRVGHGYDIHPLVVGRRLVLGGVDIDHERGLDGHSDADSLSHAITDALLGATGKGDIGQRFPADDERWKDADSLELLAIVAAELTTDGFRTVHVDATILAEEPKLLPHLGEMRRRIAASIGLPEGSVNIKATRGEGMGPIGRAEGIAAHAVATVTSP